MWLEEDVGKRINIERIEEAVGTGASTIGAACPFCITMLEDGLKRIKAKDEAETPLTQLTAVLKGIEGRSYQVTGHTDNIPIQFFK